MSAGRRGVGVEGNACGSDVQLRGSVSALPIFCCVDALIPELTGCTDFFSCDRRVKTANSVPETCCL